MYPTFSGQRERVHEARTARVAGIQRQVTGNRKADSSETKAFSSRRADCRLKSTNGLSHNFFLTEGGHGS